MGGSVSGDRAEGNAESPGVKGAASCRPWVFLRNMSEDGHNRRATLSITREASPFSRGNYDAIMMHHNTNNVL